MEAWALCEKGQQKDTITCYASVKKVLYQKQGGGHGVDPFIVHRHLYRYIYIYCNFKSKHASFMLLLPYAWLEEDLALSSFLLYLLSPFLHYCTGSKRKETAPWCSTTEQLEHLNAHLIHFGFLCSSESNGIPKWHYRMFWHAHTSKVLIQMEGIALTHSIWACKV